MEEINSNSIQLGNVKIASITKKFKHQQEYEFEFDLTKIYSATISKNKNDLRRGGEFSIGNFFYKNPYSIEIKLKSDFNEILIPLIQEIITIRNTNKKSIYIKKETKKFDNDSLRNLDTFIDCVVDNYYIVEIETKKSLKEKNGQLNDELVSVYYLMTERVNQYLNMFSQIHYSLYYCEESLINYITKYIFDLIFSMTHLPNPSLFNFLSKLCFVSKNEEGNYALVFPLKNKIKLLKNLVISNKFKFLLFSLNNTKKSSRSNKYEDKKFFELESIYEEFQYEEEFFLSKIREAEPLYEAFKDFRNASNPSQLMNNSNEPGITNVKKKYINKMAFDTTKLLSSFFTEISPLFKEYSQEDAKLFFTSSLNKHIEMMIGTKGFMNIEIITNESDENLSCQNSRIKSFGKSIFNMFNKVFGFNQGIFHMHFSVNGFSYNFNDKNYVHIFPSIVDCSVKNKLRIFDIPFKSSWITEISEFLFEMYTKKYKLFEKDKIIIDNGNEHSSEIREIMVMINSLNEKFINLIETISKDFFDSYRDALPDYLSFCNQMSQLLLEKYNSLDNLCHHFTMKSIQNLLKTNYFFFLPIETIYNLQNTCGYGPKNEKVPNLDTVIEPYLILIDKTMNEYFSCKEKKEDFIQKKQIHFSQFIQKLKKFKNSLIDINAIFSESINEKIAKEENYYSKNFILDNSNDSRVLDKYDYYFYITLATHYLYKKNKKLFTCLQHFKEQYGFRYEIKVSEKQSKTNRKKEIKKIEKLLRKTSSIRNNIKRLNLFFLDYVNKSSEKIKQLSTQYNESMNNYIQIGNKKGNNYVKIGHYLINYLKF